MVRRGNGQSFFFSVTYVPSVLQFCSHFKLKSPFFKIAPFIEGGEHLPAAVASSAPGGDSHLRYPSPSGAATSGKCEKASCEMECAHCSGKEAFGGE